MRQTKGQPKERAADRRPRQPPLCSTRGVQGSEYITSFAPSKESLACCRGRGSGHSSPVSGSGFGTAPPESIWPGAWSSPSSSHSTSSASVRTGRIPARPVDTVCAATSVVGSPHPFKLRLSLCFSAHPRTMCSPAATAAAVPSLSLEVPTQPPTEAGFPAPHLKHTGLDAQLWAAQLWQRQSPGRQRPTLPPPCSNDGHGKKRWG